MFNPESNSEELEGQGAEQSEELGEQANEQSEETQGAGEQSQEENSSEVFDSSKLTPELQKVYKKMEAAYTRKTQAVAEDRRQAEALRSQYEEKLKSLVQPKTEEEKKLIDTSQMTREQRDAYELLMEDVENRISKVASEKEKALQRELNNVKSQLGDFVWKEFRKGHPEADKLRPRMREIQNEKGGANCLLTLDEIYILAQGEKGLKQAGRDEYLRTVKEKKGNVTTKPTSTAGSEAELPFEKGIRHSKNNVLKAFQASKEAMGR